MNVGIQNSSGEVIRIEVTTVDGRLRFKHNSSGREVQIPFDGDHSENWKMGNPISYLACIELLCEFAQEV